jgi:flavin reductase (DIM6/NTAB) family NADH-FMN oxidoreductase RutF
VVISKLLFKRYKPAPFTALRLEKENTHTEAFLRDNEKQIAITNNHAIVSEQPFIIAAWSLPELVGKEYKMIIQSAGKTPAVIQLRWTKMVEMPGGNPLHIFEVAGSTTTIRSILIRSYFRLKQKKKIPLRVSRYYAAAYTLPRKVILTSFKSGDYVNMFPMDFQGHVKETNSYVLGLRNTNITLDKIADTRKLVVSEFDINNTSDIYHLGKHHSSAPPSVKSLPFEVTDSELHHFPVPAFASSYLELSISEIMNLGSHSLIISNIIHSKQLKPGTCCLYHVDISSYLSREKYYRQYRID